MHTSQFQQVASIAYSHCSMSLAVVRSRKLRCVVQARVRGPAVEELDFADVIWGRQIGEGGFGKVHPPQTCQGLVYLC